MNPIGIFDSGYGGLTIFGKIRELLPAYDYLYLGDNARAPYGTRSFETVYRFTLQAVLHLFRAGCPLVILACNTASAKALRTIQQRDLIQTDASRRVLGVIRPTVEIVDQLSRTKHIGVLATAGTVASQSYPLEIAKLFPHITVCSQACPMWVPLIENSEQDAPGADFFVHKYIRSLLQQDALIDTLVLGCTHYPLLMNKIQQAVPDGITVFAQGAQVAASLKDYLHRHPEMDCRLTKNARSRFLTTESVGNFVAGATVFLNNCADVQQVTLG